MPKIPSGLHGDLIVHLTRDLIFREAYFAEQRVCIDRLRRIGHFADSQVVEVDFERVRYLLWQRNEYVLDSGLGEDKLIDLQEQDYPIVTDWWGEPVSIYGEVS